jgi:hypothetical protein
MAKDRGVSMNFNNPSLLIGERNGGFPAFCEIIMGA